MEGDSGQEVVGGMAIDDVVLTVAELAKITKSSEAKWRKKIYRREIPVIRLNRQVRIPKSYVMKMLEAGYEPAVEK